EQLWKALHAEPGEKEDLKRPEYTAFLHPEAKSDTKAEFEISQSPVPERYLSRFSSVIAASRLREVRALRGFTRIDSIPDLGERPDVSDLEVRVAPLGLKEVDWLPGIDLRGEGVFLQLDDTTLPEWEARETVGREAARLTAQFDEWRK